MTGNVQSLILTETNCVDVVCTAIFVLPHVCRQELLGFRNAPTREKETVISQGGIKFSPIAVLL